MTDVRIPGLGPNPIEEALENYQAMTQQLAMAQAEMTEKADMVHRLMQENEFLRRNYEKAVAERDRFQALAVNLATRAVGVREAVERLLAEAVSAKAPPAEGKAPVDDGGMRGAEPVSGALADEIFELVSSKAAPAGLVQRHRTTLAPNRLS